MKTIKKILVPVDFDKMALHTVLYALELAKHHQSHVEVLYSPIVPLIYGESAYFGDDLGDDNAIMMAEAYRLEDTEAKKQLEILKNNVTEHTKKNHLSYVPIRYNFEFGSDYENINLEIQTGKFDLVVSGIYDHSHPSKLVKNLDEKLLRKAKTPIIAVPIKAKYTQLKNIAYATNLHKHSIEEIEQFLIFIKSFGVKTHCVHFGKMSKSQEEIEINVKSHFKHDKTVDFHINTNETTINNDLVKFIENHNINLLAMHPHKTNLWNKIFGKDEVESILQSTQIPIIAVH